MDELKKLLQLPDLASAHGEGLDTLLLYVHLLMGTLFIGWFGYFVYTVFRFRRSAHPRADYLGARSHFSSYAEVAVAGIEGLLLLGFAVPLWAKAVDKLPDPKKTLDIQIMAQQFQWNAHYKGADNTWGKQDIQFASQANPFGIDVSDPAAKDDFALLREPYMIPVGKDVICRISSMDVIHCFKVPRMRVTQDAIPGMSIPVHFKPTKTGEFMIICAQLCGNLHSSMKGAFKVVTQDEFDKWFAEKTKAGMAAAASE